jgi:hypothetical protein
LFEYEGVLTALAVAVLIAGCGGDGAIAPPTVISTAEVEQDRPTPFAPESVEARAPAAVSSIVESPTAVPPTGPINDDGLPSGALAFFYRVNFGSKTESLKNSGGDISWESGSRGIVRFIPETGESTVIKSIRTTSFSSSVIYPITIEGRLFVVRDGGADWSIDNQRFSIEELDPSTGQVLHSGTINAEWFTIAGDQIFHISEIVRDLFGNATGGGKQMVLDLTTGSERELSQADGRLRYVANNLLSLDGESVRSH